MWLTLVLCYPWATVLILDWMDLSLSAQGISHSCPEWILHPFLVGKCRTFRCLGGFGNSENSWSHSPHPADKRAALHLPALFLFFFLPFVWMGGNETLNNHGEIIGTKLEKLNFDEAISGSFLIALRAVKRRWRRSCRLSIPSPAPAPQTFCPPIGHSQSCFEFFQKVSCDHGFSRRLNIN